MADRIADPLVTRGSWAITYERTRQILEEGHAFAMDARLPVDDLAKAAACYLDHALGRQYGQRGESHPSWPWDRTSWKPKDRRADLIRAGALIAAALDADDERAMQQDPA